ncbi:DUF1854 domain-containing protein [Uliginosibacterium gangwonense]|uniref:cyanophycin metabolism-associated DUF1854 family protein n=1 Tax=Uliginosibacterium gangwonense TaxID=392736 RepID=UPI000363E344|nr:DUF1854 domain-containing protein [Uliginosibacterium gangwonense]
MSEALSFNLHRNSFGRLMLVDADGVEHENVLPVRAHPITAPLEGVSILSQDGHELIWIEHLDTLLPELRRLLEEALGAREFMPEIERLESVSTFATPSTWHVHTNRGSTRFVLKGEEDIRRLPGGILLIADAHGIQFMVRDVLALDRHSRKLLDRFL